MSAPVGLKKGQRYDDNGIKYQVVSVDSLGKYKVRIIGTSRVEVLFEDLKTIKNPVVTVKDSENYTMNGMWVLVNGNYEKQEYSEIE